MKLHQIEAREREYKEAQAVVDANRPKPQHTPGPWRWEFNRKHKSMHLVGGVPMYDLTIMESERWGMQHTTLTLRDTAFDGMNIMHRLCDRADWIATFPNREHHADWCANIIHPDAVLMAEAPNLLHELEIIADWLDENGFDSARQRSAIARAKP